MTVKWHRDIPKDGLTKESFIAKWEGFLMRHHKAFRDDLSALLLQAQDEAYERAAKVCEKQQGCFVEGGEITGSGYDACGDAAEAIRSLKSKQEWK